MPKTIAPPKSERTESEIAALDIPEAAIEQPEDDSVGRIIAEHIKPTLTGLVITGELSCEEWLKAAEFYQFLRSRTQWIIGDILRYGESRYGEKYAQAVDDHGKSSSRLSTYVYVCNRFEIERRRPELSFDHHSECAGLDPREADRVLLEAIKMRWTKQDVREEVAKINERNGVPKRGRKPGSTAAKVAASGKTPQVPEGEKPLIWNGYPLRTAGRLVYQGDELLQPEEAERAAHFHKFNHKEGLMNWLEEHNFRKEVEPCSPKQSEPESPKTSESASAHLPAQLDPINSGVPSTGASNGAAPNATESAPTPQIGSQDEAWIDTQLLKARRAAFDHPNQENLDELIRQAQNAVNVAPAAPPASPEPPKATETPRSVADELLAIMATYHEQEARGDIDTPGGLEHMGDVWRLLGKWERVIRTNEVSAESSRGAATAAQTPLQRAEESLLAFAAASESVDWEEIGANKLLTKKWLERLLLPCDEAIDRIMQSSIRKSTHG